SLFLFETIFKEEDQQKEVVEQKIEAIQERVTNKGAAFIEAQIAKDLSQAFFIIETEDTDTVVELFDQKQITVGLIKEVRLLGEQLEDVKKQKDVVNYLVEWNLPENLTMEQYLKRKEKNSVHYAEVPEVSFARTYVCEDMTKCLCFYDAPDQSTVEKAREAVQAPI